MRNIALLSFSIVSLLYSAIGHAAVIERSCSATETANSCNQCFYSDTNVYQGYTIGGFYDIWKPGAVPDVIYLGDNPSPVRFSTPYAGDVLQYGTMTANWQGSLYTDPTYGQYLYRTTDATILSMDPSYKIGLLNVSSAIRAAGRGSPIFQLDYIVNYYNNGDRTAPSAHKECVSYYPAWCGDGAIDNTRGETCDEGSQNGQPGRCNATCTGPTPVTPVPGVCGSASGVPVASAPSSNLCNSGNATGVTGVGPWAWTCVGSNGGATASCSASVLPPPPPAPVCSTTVTGPLTSPITTGVCNVGNVINFSTNGTNPINYTWACKNTANQIVNCSANYTVPAPTGFALSLKKYVNGDDAQPNLPVKLRVGDTFNYVIRVTNNGPGPVTGITTVSDYLPLGVVANGAPSGNGWSCTVIGVGVSCTSTSTPAANTNFNDITIPVKATTTSGMITNTASVSNPNDSSSTPGDNSDPGVIIIVQDGVCSSTVTGTQSSVLSAGTCNVGTATGFTANGTNPTNYSWMCSGVNGGNSSPSCNANYTPPVAPVTGACSSSVSGTLSAPITVGVCNIGIPSNFTAVGTNPVNYTWKCNSPNGGPASPQCNANYTPPVIPPKIDGVCSSTLTGLQTTQLTTGSCNAGSVINFSRNGTNPEIYTWNCSGTSGGVTSPTCTAKYIPPVVPPSATTFALSLKKYVDSADAQPGSPVTKNRGDTFSYVIRVINKGPAVTTGETTVTDTVPSDLSITTATISASPWNCTISGQLVTCKVTASIPANGNFPDITIPVRINLTTTIGSTITNIASVANPNETDPGNTNGTGDNTDPAVITVGNPASLQIKKYAKDIATGDTQTAPIAVAPGETFSYYYVLKNVGAGSANNVVIKDTFPAYLTHTGNISVRRNSDSVDVTSDWICTRGTYASTTRITLVCTKKTPLEANSPEYTMTVPVTVAANIPNNTNLQNIAYICADNATNNPTGPNGETICGTTNPPPPPPPTGCSDISTAQKDPACIAVGPTTFALSLKKYVDSADAQPGSPVTKNIGDTFNYIIAVTNNGPALATGISTVTDILPSTVDLSGTISASPWSCSVSNVRTVTCTSPNVSIASGSSYPNITIPVKINATATPGSTIINIASVRNPNERDNGGINDTGNNTDPAVITVGNPGGGGGGSSLYYVPKCVNGLPTCTQYVANNLADCNDANGGKCMSNVECEDNTTGKGRATLSCTTSGGPGGSTGGGGGSGYCGDGVLQPAGSNGIFGDANDEECDVGNNGSAISTWCSTNCKISITTTPGANPITDLWMTIPLLSNTRLGYDQLDATSGRISFSKNRMVIGVGTPLFTVADTIQFGVSDKYNVPLIVAADKQICLDSANTKTAVSSKRICTTFGESVAPAYKQTFGTKDYVLIGKGWYQKPPVSLGGTYTQHQSDASNEITLFKKGTANTYGPSIPGVPLSKAFYGQNPGSDTLELYHYASDGSAIDLVALDIEVTSPMVGTTSSTLSRGLELYVKPTSAIEAFLSGFKGGFSTRSTTSAVTTNTSSSNATNNVINVATQTIAGAITKESDLSAYKLNGNDNIYAIKGNLTINCAAGTITATELKGVKTLIVEDGNLTINCNNAYPSGDIASSWAFIVKGGDIQIGTNVNNLVGIYVAIPGTTSATPTGRITGPSVPTTATNNILTVNGSLYGDATELFRSRNYVRGNNAYDTLTTGVILSYSPRALNNPPPLLSQYLSNYSVTRVVR